MTKNTGGRKNRAADETPRESEQARIAAPLDFHDPDLLATALLQTLKQAGRPLGIDELLRITHLPRKAKKRVEAALFSLQDEGRLVRTGSAAWSASAKLKHVEGVLAVQRAGMGFVTPSDGKGRDIFIHPSAFGDAWHGDVVEVLVLPGRRGPSAEGRITRVLHRSRKEIAVHAVRRQKNGEWTCVPDTPRLQAMFAVDTSALPAPVQEGNLLLVLPGEKTAPGLWLATATANLEHEESPLAQERLTKSNHAIPSEFPPAALAEAARLPADPPEEEYTGAQAGAVQRRDLRDHDFVTIDGRTARDFDDAVCVFEDATGFRLLVAIADVAHYVRSGGALDAEARLRGNSCYFPLSVEPMLPEELSNGLCSLRPGVPRLVMVADMRFTSKGDVRGAEFYSGVIRSKARLTYGQIQRGLLLHEPEEEKSLAPVLPMLQKAEKLARLLAGLRAGRGSLDFDLPEAEFQFNEAGEIVHIGPRERHFGHRIIEEFMIAANEAVARFLAERQRNTLYRVHPQPDEEKLTALMTFLEETGLGENPLAEKRRAARGKGKKVAPASMVPTARDLRQILAKAAGTPQEYTINRMVLRSMMQARYATENDGHFGLASECYCHFTSPIRRYADLVVHRALKDALGFGEGEKLPSPARLETIAEHINGTERTAMDAEREIHKRLTALFLQGKVGESYDGLVSGLTDFGMFVELPSLMAEGMVPFSGLGGDYYEYLPERQELRGSRTGRIFRLGQKLRVRITDVNLARQEVNLALDEEGIAAVEGAPGRRPERALKKRPARSEDDGFGRKPAKKAAGRGGRGPDHIQKDSSSRTGRRPEKGTVRKSGGASSKTSRRDSGRR